jgi:ParB-like chromosome segregation protein Spo0J
VILKIAEITGYNEISYDWSRKVGILAKSIEKHGLVNPIVVRKVRRSKYSKARFRVIDGALRVHAMIILGKTEINGVIDE